MERYFSGSLWMRGSLNLAGISWPLDRSGATPDGAQVRAGGSVGSDHDLTSHGWEVLVEILVGSGAIEHQGEAGTLRQGPAVELPVRLARNSGRDGMGLAVELEPDDVGLDGRGHRGGGEPCRLHRDGDGSGRGRAGTGRSVDRSGWRLRRAGQRYRADQANRHRHRKPIPPPPGGFRSRPVHYAPLRDPNQPGPVPSTRG